MGNSNNLEMLRDEFRNAADILDELVALDEREKRGEDVSKECEGIMGRYIMAMVKIDTLAKNI